MPNGAQPESPHCRESFKRLSGHPDVSLVYVSGRDQLLVEDAIVDYDLPMPDFAVTDVGTRILRRSAGKWNNWLPWVRHIDVSWAGHDHATLSQLLSALKPLQIQEPPRQNVHKLSYYFPVEANRNALEQEILVRLETTGARINCVWSVDEVAGRGLLDVLPERASKLHAIDFICKELGFSYAELLFAGDSGNDLQVLTSAVPAVLVANAAEVVRQEAIKLATQTGNADTLYLARGGFLGMNGNYSAGILEGVNHFCPEFTAHLDTQ